MAKPLRILGTVLGAVALVVPGLQAFGIAAIAGFSTAAIGAAAGLAAGLANIGSQALAKAPPARGSVSQILIMPDAPTPYVMGTGHFAGVLRHRAAYGGTIDGIPNPYLWDAVVYSGGGPVQSITPRVDFAAVPSWYSGYLATDTQTGATPEGTALAAAWGSPTGWGAAHKLSGQAAIGWNYKFDKAGKKFAGGLPVTGALIAGVKVYDPRLDSTFPGGSGPCRLGNEATYVYSDSPALHAGTYAYGRYQNGVRVYGIGQPADGIDFAVIAAWANVCAANGWTMFGVVYEPADKWVNLRDICAAGGGEPAFARAVLSFRFDAPQVALDTVTAADIAGSVSVTAMQSWRDRLNTIIPKFRSPTHNWEMVQAAAVQVPSYLAEDGEERREEWPFNFVINVDQVAQLAAYKLVNSRELHPITLEATPRLRGYRPGQCLHIYLPELGLDTDAILLWREFDPATLMVRMIFIGETPAKHDYALGRTGTPPATPALTQVAQDRDEIAGTIRQGADGEPLYGGELTNPTQSVTCDSDGNVLSYSGVAGEFKMLLGSEYITANCTFAIPTGGNPQGLTGPFSGVPLNSATGTYIVTGGFDADELNATLRMRATHTATGATFDKVFSLSKSMAGDGADVDLSQLEADTAAALSAIATSNSTIAGMQGDLAAMLARLDSVEGEVATLTSTVATQGSSITTNATAITGLTGNYATLSFNVSALSSNVNTNASAITTTNTNLANLTTRVSTAEGSIVTQGSVLSSLGSTVSSLSSTVTSQGVTITGHSTALTTASGNISTLFGRAGVIVDVNGRVTSWEINNNGTVGNFKVHTDYFEISKPGSGERFMLTGGKLLIYDTGNNLIVELGVGL